MRKRILGALLICSAALLLFGCEDEGGPVGGDADFRFTMTVRDTDGDPVPGLEAKLHVPIVGDVVPSAVGPQANTRPRTSIRFQAAELCRATFEVFDLEDRLLRTLFDGELDAGLHELDFDGNTQEGTPILGTAVLRLRAKAYDLETEALLFEDSIHPVLYTGIDSAQRPSLGTSDRDGILRSADVNLFPAAADLPVLEGYDVDGNELGVFTISETVEIHLRDPLTQREQMVEVEIGPGRNSFDVVWDPPIRQGGQTARDEIQARSPGAPGKDEPVPPEFELSPNVPNPFN